MHADGLDFMGRRRLHDRVSGPLERHAQAPADDRRLPHPGEGTERVHGNGSAELDLQPLDGDVAKVLQRVDDHQPTLAQDRDPVGDALDLGEGVRGQKHGAASSAGLGEQPMETLLHERIKAGDRLVQDQQFRLMHERLNQAELLAVAGRQLTNRRVELRVETHSQRVTDAPIDPTPEVGKVVEDVRTGELWVEREIAGKETNPATDLKAVLSGVESEHRSAARGRLIRSRSRRIVVDFPAPLGPRKPKTSPCSISRSSAKRPCPEP
jgi:hypothetical protein